jgi:hypothetical protein
LKKGLLLLDGCSFLNILFEQINATIVVDQHEDELLSPDRRLATAYHNASAAEPD